MPQLRRPRTGPVGRENMAPRAGFEPAVVGLEDRLPSFGRGEVERKSGVEPDGDNVGNVVSHHVHPRLVAAGGFAPSTSDLSGRCSSA